MTAANHSPAAQVALAVAFAGLAGEVLFELYAWLVSPALFGAALQPAKLVMALSARLAGTPLPYETAFALHFLIGSLGFGAFVFLVRQLFPQRPGLTGVVAGVTLWFVAQGILAPVIGRPFMMDFGPYTQSSFIGHVGMTMIIAYLLHFRLTATRNLAPAIPQTRS